MALCTSVVVHRAMLSMAATLALTQLLVLVHTGRAVDPAWDINGYRPRPAKSSRSHCVSRESDFLWRIRSRIARQRHFNL